MSLLTSPEQSNSYRIQMGADFCFVTDRLLKSLYK